MADPENESPYNLDRRKNRVVQGVFSESAFQLSLVDRADPLSLSTFPMFGFHCVPHIGVYGAEFQPSLPFVLIHLPARLDLLRAQLPPTVGIRSNLSASHWRLRWLSLFNRSHGLPHVIAQPRSLD